jgi:tetratricopeptide (TPR) repeat protein
VINCLKLLLLVLLVKPAPGFGRQQPASRLESLVAAAQQAQAAKDYAAAANAYRQAIRIQPTMPELWANLGLMQQEAADISQAILSFQQANRLNPSLYVPNLFLGIDYLRAGKATEATPFLLKAEKINKTDPQPSLALGRAYISSGRFSAAAQELVRAANLDPRLSSAWFALGIARLDQVEEDARRMSAEGQDSPYAKALFAESLEKQARFREAATLYRSLLDSRPQPPCLHSELGFSLLREHDLPGAASEFAAERAAHPECGLALLGQARMAMAGGDNELAIKLLEELWDRDHGFFESNAAILLEGESSERVSAIASLISAESTLIPMDLRNALLAAFNLSGQEPGDNIDQRESGAPPAPEPASAGRRTAEDYYAAGQFQQCARRLEPGFAAGSADKLRLLAACSFFAGDNERASGAATALAALQPHSLEALYWSIQANERLAFKSLARFQQLEPESARNHILLGDIYHQLERFDDAQAEYLKALGIAPGDPAAMLGLASVYLANNNIEKALETARLALEHSPEDPELNLVMAEAMLGKNEFAEAEPFLMKGLKAKPQMVPHVHALIGKVYAETGRTQDAIDQLKMGASSDVNGSLHYQLARLYRTLGDDKDASAALEEMKTIKQRRRDRGVKTVEDPDLSALEAAPSEASTP